MELKYKHLYKTVLSEYQNLSKCARLKVAALLVEKGRIISCGYNGTPPGHTNCNELFKTEAGKFYYRENTEDVWIETDEESWKTKHHEFANENELHAEMNCIALAVKNNIPIYNYTMVVSHQPCENCAKLIYSVGIKKVMFVEPYDRGSKSIEFLEKNGVEIEQI